MLADVILFTEMEVRVIVDMGFSDPVGLKVLKMPELGSDFKVLAATQSRHPPCTETFTHMAATYS